MNMSRQQIEKEMQVVSDDLRVKLEESFKDLPVHDASAAMISVLMDLAITYAVISGLSAPVFVKNVLSVWKITSDGYEQFCKYRAENEHLH